MRWTKSTGSRKQRKHQLCELRQLLRCAAYPYAHDWTPALLTRSALHLLRVGRVLAGAAWFEPLRPGEVALHLCVHPDLRGRWVTPRSLKYLAASARATDAHGVWASPLPEHRPLVVRLGFEGSGPFYLPLHVEAQNRSPSPTAAA